MKGFKAALRRCLHLGTGGTLLLAAVSGALLAAVFATGRQQTPPVYAVYGLSAYALCVLCGWLFRLGKKARALVRRVPQAARYQDDREYRALASLYLGLGVSLAYAGFKLFMSWRYASGWFLACAVYYAVLGAIRFFLLRSARRAPALDSGRQRLRHELHACRLCGWLVLALTLAMAGMAAPMVWQDESARYPGSLIYAAAAYAFYSLISAARSVAQLRGSARPVLQAARLVGLACALMSLFSLQTAMLAEFGAAVGAARRQWNAATGAAVCLLVFGLAVYLLRRTARSLRAVEAAAGEERAAGAPGRESRPAAKKET